MIRVLLGAFADIEFFEGLNLVQSFNPISFAAKRILINRDRLSGISGFI